MRRYMFPGFAGIAGVLLLALALVSPVAASRGQMGDGSAGSGDPVSIEQARDRVSEYLDETGQGDLAVGEVMQFSNHFYAMVVDPVSGDGAFELLITRDGRTVHPEPTMMWNTEYNPMSGSMMSGNMMGGMMGGSMAGGMMGDMMGSDNADQEPMMDPSQCQGMMDTMAESRRQLEQPLITDEAVTVAQDWLADNQPELVASEPVSFPGYVTLHTERDGQTVGMLSVQTTTGAVWAHAWHDDFIAIDHGA